MNWQSLPSGWLAQGGPIGMAVAWGARGSRGRKEARMGIAKPRVVKRIESCILSGGKGR